MDDAGGQTGHLVVGRLCFEPDFQQMNRLLHTRMFEQLLGRDGRRCLFLGVEARHKQERGAEYDCCQMPLRNHPLFLVLCRRRWVCLLLQYTTRGGEVLRGLRGGSFCGRRGSPCKPATTPDAAEAASVSPNFVATSVRGESSVLRYAARVLSAQDCAVSAAAQTGELIVGVYSRFSLGWGDESREAARSPLVAALQPALEGDTYS